jgi:hypothetical protein
MSGYEAKSCNALQKPTYRPIEAAIRWCGLIEYEGNIMAVLEQSGLYIPAAGQFPEWPCLRANTEKIFDGLAHGEIAAGRDGCTVAPDDHVAAPRRTVRHNDLRKWMAKHYPDQKPEFLFDEIERSSHASINVDSFLALQADLTAVRADLARHEQSRMKIAKERDSLLGERDSLRAMIEKLSVNTGNSSERQEKSNLHIIGALLQNVMDEKLFPSEESLRKHLAEKYQGYSGCAERTLAGRFAEAKKLLSE